MRHGFRVHVAGQDHRGPVSEGDVADGIGAILDDRLQPDALEPRLAHRGREERGEVALFTEDARDPAHLLDQINCALEVERGQHAFRCEPCSGPDVHPHPFGHSGITLHAQLYGR